MPTRSSMNRARGRCGSMAFSPRSKSRTFELRIVLAGLLSAVHELAGRTPTRRRAASGAERDAPGGVLSRRLRSGEAKRTGRSVATGPDSSAPLRAGGDGPWQPHRTVAASQQRPIRVGRAELSAARCRRGVTQRRLRVGVLENERGGNGGLTGCAGNRGRLPRAIRRLLRCRIGEACGYALSSAKPSDAQRRGHFPAPPA
jgi:hypothetical protein